MVMAVGVVNNHGRVSRCDGPGSHPLLHRIIDGLDFAIVVLSYRLLCKFVTVLLVGRFGVDCVYIGRRGVYG